MIFFRHLEGDERDVLVRVVVAATDHSSCGNGHLGFVVEKLLRVTCVLCCGPTKCLSEFWMKHSCLFFAVHS